ncbi:MAG: hypothetical protein ACR2NP_18575, partial [Pirellulaceae bacterium]
MVNFPFGYHPIEPSTWAYLSSLLMLALFFKFNRFWSVRNFDLILLILLAPGLLMVHYGGSEQRKLEDGAREAAVSQVDNVRPGEMAQMASGAVQNPESSEDGNLEASLVAPPRQLNRYQKIVRWGYIWLFGMGLIWLIRLFYDPL